MKAAESHLPVVAFTKTGERIVGQIAKRQAALNPERTILLGLIAGWAMVTGVIEIVAAIQLRKQISGEWLLALSGIASLLFGVALLINPGVGALAVVWIIGAYAIVFGVLLLALGFKLRGLEHRAHGMTPRTV